MTRGLGADKPPSHRGLRLVTRATSPDAGFRLWREFDFRIVVYNRAPSYAGGVPARPLG